MLSLKLIESDFMFTVAFMFRRKPGLTREQFEVLYLEHQAVMVEQARGLIGYVQHKTTEVRSFAGMECNTGLSDFDALSVYTYESESDAVYTSSLVAVAMDSERFIDFSTMVTLVVAPSKVL